MCCVELVVGKHKRQSVKSAEAEAPLSQTAARFAVLVLLLFFSSPDLL